MDNQNIAFTQEVIAQQRSICDKVKREGAFTLPEAESVLTIYMPAALDALEASMRREAEKDATIARLTAERDAAVSAIRDVCDHCGFHGNASDAQCKKCECQFIAWRILCAENAEEKNGDA